MKITEVCWTPLKYKKTKLDKLSHIYLPPPGMTIQQPLVLDVGPKEFDIGLTYTGSSRTTAFTNLALDPMPSFNRILKIFSMTRFKEKEAEIKRREGTIASEETARQELRGTVGEGIRTLVREVAMVTAGEDDEDEMISSQLSNISL